MGSLLHPIGLDKVPSVPRRVWTSVVEMDNQLLTGRSWLFVAPTDNLRQDFSSVVGGVKAPGLRKEPDDMKPRRPQTIVSMRFGE
jgi:hypothetical protein